jgi:hypothetical protein
MAALVLVEAITWTVDKSSESRESHYMYMDSGSVQWKPLHVHGQWTSPVSPVKAITCTWTVDQSSESHYMYMDSGQVQWVQ